MTKHRKSLEDTWKHLEALFPEEEIPRDAEGRPFVPAQMPNADDEGRLGFSYFRYGLEDADNSCLTLPRTFFGRSWFSRVNFAGSDLSESRMCWNDFEYCDFSHADLSGCDMRASRFENCRFNGALLRGADLRGSTFSRCDFADADLTQAIAENQGEEACVRDFLNDAQRAVMVWHADAGEEPPGG